MRKLLCLFLCCISPWLAANQYDNVERIVVIGDVHGAFPEFVALLRAQGIIDEQLNWQGGKTHLVSLGDLLDRGPQSAQAMNLLMQLQSQAPAQEGQVHVLLGNHEVMNLTGDLRDVSDAEMSALAKYGGHSAAFSEDGHFGRWLLTLPFIIRIDDTLFTHGGLASHLDQYNIQQINQRAREDLLNVLRLGKAHQEQGLVPLQTDFLSAHSTLTSEQQSKLSKEYMSAMASPFLGPLAPQWYRGNVSCHPILETPKLHQTLTTLKAKRLVVGHSPTPNRQVNQHLAGRLYAIDTGMLRAVYKGNSRGLIIHPGKISAFDQDGPAPITPVPEKDPILTLTQQSLTQLGEDTSKYLSEDDTRVLFTPLKPFEVKRALAAYKLDRLLGLHMVPATARRTLNGESGIVTKWVPNFSEAVRSQRQLNRPNYCEKDSDYSLLAIFDTLIGQVNRSPNNLWYVRNNWHIVITENFNAFGTRSRLPQYATPPTLPQAMATKLKALEEAELMTVFDGLLKKREIRALLKRRDAILAWPSS